MTVVLVSTSFAVPGTFATVRSCTVTGALAMAFLTDFGITES